MSQTATAIGVVIPVYNRPESVLEALGSVARQTLIPRRLIVVDDGSTDDTADRIQRWMDCAKLPFEHRLIRQPNSGPSRARNAGAQAVGPVDLLAFLDSDDLWPEDYLRKMSEAMRPTDCVAVSCDRRFIETSLNRVTTLRAAPLQGCATRALLLEYCPNPSSTVMRHSAYLRSGGMDHRYGVFEDLDLFLRVSLMGRWGYVADCAVDYRQLQTGSPPLTGRMGAWRNQLSMIRLIRRFLALPGAAGAISPAEQAEFHCIRWHAAGKALMREKRWNLAAACFGRAIKCKPLHTRSINRLIQALAMRRIGGGGR